MKFKIDKEYAKKYKYIAVTLCLVILFYKVIDNLSPVGENMLQLITFLNNAIKPFILAFVLTYFLYKPIISIEERLLRRKYFSKHPKKCRVLSIIIVYVLFLTGILLFIYAAVPRMIESIKALIENFPTYFAETQFFFEGIKSDSSIGRLLQQLKFDSTVITESNNTQEILLSLLENTQLALDKIVQIAVERALLISTLVINLFLGIIISLYLMVDEKAIRYQVRKFFKALLPKKIYINIIKLFKIFNEIFFKYFIGKVLCSILIGFLCLVGLLILNVKHASLISLIIGVTNIIPYFGPIIGAVPGVIITLFYSPIKALWVLIWIIIIQQFDGNYLAPRVLGDMVGLRPFWIIFSIILGGKLFGVLGMFLAVPVFAVLKVLILAWINKNNPDRIPIEGPNYDK